MYQPDHKLLTIKDVMELTGIKGRSTIYRKLHNGLMPAAVSLSGRVRWRSDEIHSWIESLPTKEYPNTSEVSDGR